MEELVKAVENLGKKDIIDYLIIIVPIVISIVAIVISIVTAKKQNKIALFEKKYEALFQLKTVISFAQTIEQCEKLIHILQLFDSFWGANLSNTSQDDILPATKYQIEIIKNDVEQIAFLFECKFYDSAKEIIKKLHQVMMDATEGKVIQEHIADFVNSSLAFYDKDFKELENQTSIAASMRRRNKKRKT